MTAASTAIPTSSATGPSSAALAGLDDFALAEWLTRQKKDGNEVVLVHAGTTCKVYEKTDIRGVLLSADPEGKSKRAFKALAKQKRLYTVGVSPSEIADATTVGAAWVPQQTSEQEIDTFVEQRKAYLGRAEGRGDPITPETANQVWADAGGCCMFQGCGQDLSVVPLYNKGARIAYLAHIIASDPRGPRGTSEDSHRLSNHPENIMLMCDAHHRLIDSFAPDRFDAQRLRDMRRYHTAKVRSYRAAMRHRVAQVVTIFGDIGATPTHFPDSEFMEALLSEELSMHPEVKRHLVYQSRDDRTAPGFWGNYLREMQLQIGLMVQSLSRPTASPPDELAVFPLHHSATLVLAGRIVGEARRVRVFQPSRRRKSWLWNRDAEIHPAGTFKVIGNTDSPVEEVLLTVELTAHIDESAIPESLATAIAGGAIRRIRLTTDAPNGECLQRKEDLDQVMGVARSLINDIQDKMHAGRVHLIAVAPASAAFSIGQLMQAGHHAAFTLYDRANWEQPFREAFTITGHSVLPPAGSDQTAITIR
ncbi:HNH endonuclease [Ralstonia pseudosolanacearum]|uniref:SAVED domain-containing protein n=1 Tax=Ralstonia pseudosolanacearum TaxID=1310165 RepID=UPI000DAB63E8|nr:SAVED domain-containing protein [Ralstonia pseudosolanacearum]MCK4136106.1 HNH endonuclease [Ralstonia pseudosolanacearum]RAA05921.1 HNH endonuclease [Ralstonia pseudosolanacearum]UQY82591.1 SAVED domain-containing protein [Ralstonia pseudosolanacearum]